MLAKDIGSRTARTPRSGYLQGLLKPNANGPGETKGNVDLYVYTIGPPVRQYSPNLRRWFSTDPERGCVGNPQGLNLYPYVVNNPTNLTDRLGNQWLHPSDLFSIPCLPYTVGCWWQPGDPWGTYGTSSPAIGGNPDFCFYVYYSAISQAYSASAEPTESNPDPGCKMCRAKCKTEKALYTILCLAGAYYGLTGYGCLVAVEEKYATCQDECNEEYCREEVPPTPPFWLRGVRGGTLRALRR